MTYEAEAVAHTKEGRPTRRERPEEAGTRLLSQSGGSLWVKNSVGGTDQRGKIELGRAVFKGEYKQGIVLVLGYNR